MSYPTHDLRDPDTMRYRMWEHDFDSLVANNAMPALSTMAYDLTHIDSAPDAVMNAMLWKAIRGEEAKVPTLVRAAFVKTIKKADDDDD